MPLKRLPSFLSLCLFESTFVLSTWSLLFGCSSEGLDPSEGSSSTGGSASDGTTGVSGGAPGSGGIGSSSSGGSGGQVLMGSGGAVVDPGGAGGTPGGAGGTAPGMSGGAPGAGGSEADPGGFSTDRGTFLLGEASRCAQAGFAVCEDFEGTNPGSLPGGWTMTGYGTRTAQVSEAQSARGGRSLEVAIDGNQSAVVGMVRLPSLGDLDRKHFGRMFYRIQGPGVTEFVHFDVLAAIGPWMGHENEVRFASTGTGVGTAGSNWSWIYNVQPFGDGGGAEFGSEGDRSAHAVVDEWMCLEWFFDSDAQKASFFQDGELIDYLEIDDERSEIPVLSSLAVGLQKFQSTGPMKAWVDEVALDDERVGCNY